MYYREATFLALKLLLLLYQQDIALGRKPYKMTIMSLISMTGNGYKDGKACMAAQNFVLDNVNNRDDILPLYHVIPDFVDEGPGSMYAPKGAISYLWRMEILRQNNPNSYQSPIMIGLMFTPGCKTLGRFVQYLDSVIISTTCLSNLYTANRSVFKNLYRPRMSSEVSNYAMVAFIKSNGWSQVGLYANADNQYNTMIANHFHDVATTSGIKVTWYEAASGFSQGLLDSLILSGVRIIVFQAAELPVLYSFLCLAYNNGIRGPKYFFIFGVPAWSDPSFLPDVVGPGCTRSIVVEQYGRSVIIGATAVPFTNKGNTTILQYDLPTFEAQFAKFTGWAQQPMDFEDKYMCHDRILQAVLALDRAEKRLLMQNMSLRDYQNQPGRVLQAVNESVAETDFVGLRIGRMKYSKRLEMDDEANLVVSRQTDQGFLANYEITRQAGSDLAEISAYSLRQVRGLNWSTANGLTPRDFATLITFRSQLSEGSSLTILVVATILAAVKIVLCFITWFRKQNSGEWMSIAVYTLTMLGCVTLDAAAVTFSFRLSDFGGHVCIARPFLLAIGLCLLVATCFGRLSLLNNVLRTKMALTVAPRLPGNAPVTATATHNAATTGHLSTLRTGNSGKGSTRNVISTIPIALSKEQNIPVFIGTAVFVLLNVGVLIGLVYTEPPTRRQVPVTLLPVYDKEQDTLTTVYIDVCFSETQHFFYGALVAAHGLLLLFACYFAYCIRSSKFTYLADKLSCIAVVNTLTLLTATVCILFLLENVLHAQEVVVSIAAIVVSASVSALLSFPIFSDRSQTNA